ncbi:MAG: hypothetical protein GDA43_06570 [Hormoscilla sp. SP5CHS1]|nr:hypothetical protein [Hormoscilla sp. SP12CHS1]MBC6452902.1 hypothetical protein [Hormoscilla sp. SP5CHS1]
MNAALRYLQLQTERLLHNIASENCRTKKAKSAIVPSADRSRKALMM